MSIASKVFGIWALNRTVTSTTSLFMRLLAGVAAVVVCAVMAAIILTILIAGGVWLLYGQFTTNGMDSQSAALVIGGLLLALLGSLVSAARSRCRRLYSVSKGLLNYQLPLGGQIYRAIDAFLDGFNSSRQVP